MTRLVSGEPAPFEAADKALRPQTLAEFVGQEQAKGNLQVFIDAASAPGRGAGPRAAVRPARAWARPPWPRSSPASWG